jgi:predicted phage tail protein
MCGGVLLQEFYSYTWLQLWMYIMGISICMGGIFIMLVLKQDTKAAFEIRPVDQVIEPLIVKKITSINEDI